MLDDDVCGQVSRFFMKLVKRSEAHMVVYLVRVRLTVEGRG